MSSTSSAPDVEHKRGSALPQVTEAFMIGGIVLFVLLVLFFVVRTLLHRLRPTDQPALPLSLTHKQDTVKNPLAVDTSLPAGYIYIYIYIYVCILIYIYNIIYNIHLYVYMHIY
jgi:hypothetical protein